MLGIEIRGFTSRPTKPRPRVAARTYAAVAATILTLHLPRAHASGDAADGSTTAPADQRYATHWQATYVEQATDGFAAPYAGTNSLTPVSKKETFDATLYLGVRPWRDAELWVTPEIDQGFGLDNTLGVAGFPSGEAYKVGKNQPYFRLPRAFVRQTINDDSKRETVDGVANQLAGSRSTDRWVITIGKFGVTDIFDTNRYAHDPRSDFLNWAAVDSGSFDYAADAWGFTVGAAVERYVGSWTLRGGVFDLSDVPNSAHLEPGFHEFQLVGEIEKRFSVSDQTGRVLLTCYDSRGRMALLDQAIVLGEATGTIPDPSKVRAYRSRLGVSMALEQPVNDTVGFFARLGKAAGNVEAYEFTDIDRSVEVGSSIKGRIWGRSDDTLGIAGIVNGISAIRERYLNAGGLGILVGDGKLPHPGAEQIIETYYSITATRWASVSFDYQWVKNPGYNRDRGPVSILAVRAHVQF